MARSKQTAKKSTGAPAPRITLQRSSSRIKRAQKLVNIASSGKRPASNRKGRSITNSITFNIQPDVPTHVLTVEVRGPVNLRADMDKDHDEWCTACRNGGDCICCESCLRVVCSRCIEYPKNASVVVCPSCYQHLDQNKGRKRIPYEVDGHSVVFKSQGSTRESFPRCVSEPLAIVSLTLQGLADDGPSKPAYDHLVPYLRGNACYVNLDFNFSSDAETQSFSERLETLVEAFESGDLQRFRRFFVFLSTHSDPERGDLHVSPGNQSSATAEQVFQQIFYQTRFGKLLKKSRDSVLALVSCGAIVSYPEPLESIRNLSAQKYFHQILAFTQPSLQPCFSNKFVLDYAVNRFVYLRDNVEGYIYDHQVLGAHTNLYFFSFESNSEAWMFVWSHPGQRPMGNHCPQQCPSCFALRPWTPKSHPDKVEHKCKGCGKSLFYFPISHSIMIGGDAGERGTWWKRKPAEA